MRKYLLLPLLIVLIGGCGLRRNLLKQISVSEDTKLAPVFQNAEKYELQIMYSRIIKKNGGVEFHDYKYRVDSEAYFYPASTVKLPIAVLSLEKLNELNTEGVKIDKNTSYYLESDSVENRIEDDIKAIFAVSDNEAYNRLFEFLGQDYINSRMKAKGLASIRISHRFSGEGSGDTLTRQMIFKTEDGDFELPVTNNAKADSLEIYDVIKGKAYMKEGEKVDEPFSFALKNYFPVETQHNLMKRLFFPEVFEKCQIFDLTKEDKMFLKEAMSNLPRELDYDETKFYDSYGKFFIYGDSKERIPAHVKIYNKVGYAYGTLTETAYIEDEKNDIQFLLTATLLVNKNEIFNDNIYEYDNIGIPFLAELGRQLYQKELLRRKN
ncbi:serine hydrolase [Gramella sp. MAR_2010_147]|uniref:serine hydrolase n=1 Tax=Gramella sp. MAR_2010_147 TaxID=1250205 RepID=UPI00087C6437|nr:serine hydrolase [Gramella sp. MAR_2010_147]SDS59332.1 Beta-lactamase enzyme family protein [Gramella sp. MAR_2010_147]